MATNNPPKWHNYFLRVQMNTLIENTFCEKLFFFEVWSKLFLTFGKILTESLSKLFYTCSDNFVIKQFFFTFCCFSYNLGQWAKFFLMFGTKTSTRLPELLSTRSDEHFDGKQFSKILLFLLDFCRNLSRFFAIFLESCQNCFLTVYTDCMMKNNFSERFFMSFALWEKLFLPFSMNFTEPLSKPFSTFSWNILTKQISSFFFCFC